MSPVGVRVCLVGISDMPAYVAMMPTLSAKNHPTSNVANAMTGFMAGYMSADVLPHDFQVISMTCGSITPTEIAVIFLEKNGLFL